VKEYNEIRGYGLFAFLKLHGHVCQSVSPNILYSERVRQQNLYGRGNADSNTTNGSSVWVALLIICQFSLHTAEEIAENSINF
jgi:hypothetical protein